MMMINFQHCIIGDETEEIERQRKKKSLLHPVDKRVLRLERRSISKTTINDSMVRINDSDECLFRGDNAILFAL
jgi:hypothetical protein